MFDQMFFACRSELLGIVEELQCYGKLFATAPGLINENTRPVIDDLMNLPALQARTSLQELLRAYLLMDTAQFVVTEIPQERGGVRYDVDMMGNPNAWYFVVGGEVTDKMLVPGRMCGRPEGKGERLKAAFRKSTAGFSKEGPFLVSPDARRLALAGGRLVANGNPDSPLDYDLTIDA